MDKLTAIKIKYQDGTYSEQIPIGASVQNINWNENHSLVDILGEVDLSKGNIQRQINLKPDLGETSSTAYRGDRGKTAYNHATDSNRLTTAKSVGLYKVAATSEGHVSNLTSVTKSDITNLGIPASDTNVTQTSSSTNASYEVLFSGTADDTTRTEGARKSSGLTFNPSTKNLTVTKINGVTVGNSPKFTDEDHITTATTSGSGNAVTSISANNQGALTIIKGTTFVTDQDGVSGSSINRFGVCNTGASTAAKTISITSGTFSLIAGAAVAVKFTYTNTANSPTLNVGSTGAKSIYVNGAQITSGGNKSLLSGTVEFVYDGSHYNLIGAGNVTGVKGDKESSYRTGNINITPSNIGATMAKELTEAEYNALPESEKLADKIFLITDSIKGQLAEEVSYDNTDSRLTATNVQDAINEISGLKEDLTQSVDDLKSALDEIDLIRKNLFAARTITEGYYITSTGSSNSNPDWGFVRINVQPSTKYSISGGRSIICYFTGNTAISGNTDDSLEKIITTPKNADSMTVSVYLKNKDLATVVESDTIVPARYPYGAMKSLNNVIHPATYQNDLPDANSALRNTAYRFIGFEKNTTSIPANLPFSKWDYSYNDEAFLIDFSSTTSLLYREQLFIVKNRIYARAYSLSNSAWYAWRELLYSPTVIEVDINHPGSKDYTSLTKAIIDNVGKKNVKIIVHPGVYDMISELEEIYGAGYLDNLTERWFGCTQLGDGIHIVFAEGAVVKCEYQGNNTYARNYFSPFNAASGGFTLENLNISCSGVRYCVHDERSSGMDVYQNYYLNCEMYKDSDNGHIQEQCIGGGLGVNGQIIIKDCYFNGDKTESQMLVSYHNSSSGNAKSKIVVSGCYFDKKGRIRFAHYGSSLTKTMCLVSNNSFGSNIEIAYESSSYHVENMTVIDWNNVIRQ